MFKLVTEPIRLAYINELDENQLDVEFIKDCCDNNATIPLDKMYGKMCENARIQATFITTSNRDPNLITYHVAATREIDAIVAAQAELLRLERLKTAALESQMTNILDRLTALEK